MYSIYQKGYLKYIKLNPCNSEQEIEMGGTKELRNDLNKDPWGLFYKIEMRKTTSLFTKKRHGEHNSYFIV